MSKGMRWWITDNTDNSGWSVDTKFSRSMFGSCNVFEVMDVTDHERIVDELKAEINGLKERLDVFRNREYEARNIEELKAEVKRITSQYQASSIEWGQTIAKQAKVIEKLTEQRNRAADRHHGQSLAKYKEKIKKFEAEIAEIERGEA